MTYTQIALIAVFIAAFVDMKVLQTQLLKRQVFWTSYAIIIGFQLLTNWWLTSRNIVMYSPDAILGIRIASAPAEDLFFGFALVLSVMSTWVYLGRKGIDNYRAATALAYALLATRKRRAVDVFALLLKMS